MEIAIFLALLDRLGNVDLPFLLTKGGPLNLTNVWGVFIFQASFAKFDLGYGASLGVMLFLVGLPFAVWYVRRARRQLAGLGVMRQRPGLSGVAAVVARSRCAGSSATASSSPSPRTRCCPPTGRS